jgi:outer membrane protein OmpA-like peptidoglycan-associated protein/outer membrane protein W
MQIRNALLAATLLALPLAAQAQPVTGLYIAGGAGVNLMLEEPINSVTVGGTTTNVNNGNLETQAGAVGVVSLGWGFGNGLRAEIEGDYRYNGYRSVSNSLGNSVSINNNNHGGNEQKYGPMVNVLYDFTTLSPVVIPYVGAGVGYQWALEKVNIGNSGGSQTEGAFAYQAILGAAFPIPPVPGLAVTAEYRFMGLAGNRTYNTSAGNSIQLGNDFNNSILIGLRYNFLPPPPPPPAPMAAPAPAPARSYLVFFDWDKATLTPRAQQIIAEAAANSTKVKYTQIQVNGYTDTSGTPQYNQGLSIRRAQSVAAELVKDGVPKGAIAIQGFGETHLLVPTGPGVREPQNRRVEIIIR